MHTRLVAQHAWTPHPTECAPLTFHALCRSKQQQELQPRLLQACAWSAEQHQLDLTPAQVERHLAQLCALLPELHPWLLYIADNEPSLLAALLLDPATLQAKLLELKRLLPAADIGKLAARHPYVLFTDSWTVEVVLQRVREGRKVEDLNEALETDPE